MSRDDTPAPAGHPALTVDGALQAARRLGLDRLDAQWLLGHVLQRDRTWLLTHDQDPLPPDAALRFDALCTRRAAGEPFAYLVGEREFHGLRLRVSPAVLVPRPDTETLVDWALERLAADHPPGTGRPPRVLDLGTGSGAIALAVAQARPDAEVHAVDRSPAALEVARANARALGLDARVRLHEGSWWQGLPPDLPRFDLVLSNPPYIAEDDPHMADLGHEPREALVAAEDGLADLRAITEGAPARLAPGGWLLFEHGWTQADAVAALLRAHGFGDVGSRKDLGAQWRCTGGRLSAA